MAHFITLCCLLVLTSSAAAFQASFSQSTYYGKVFTLEDPVGKTVFKAELLYNKSMISSFVTKHYSLYRSDATYFAIDNNGSVTLRRPLLSRRQYSFQLSLLYTVGLTTGDTRSGFLTADCRVQGIGAVYFDNSTYRVEVTTALEQYDHVYDFNKHILYNATLYSRVYYEFDYVYSSYFAIEASTGVLYTRRALVPGSFAVRIEIEYDATLLNGTLFSDDDYVYVTVVAIGCRDLEESKAMWPETYPCSGYTLSCSSLDSYFISGTMTRICSRNGNWLAPDFTQCAVREGAGPFALVWMTFSTSSGSYFISQLARIKRDISGLFPRGSVDNITLVTGFRSNVQYGFMGGFRMVVNPTLLSEANIRAAWVRLKSAFRFGSIYLRSGTTGIAGRGIRVFNETRAQCNTQTLVSNDTSYVQVCGGSSCNCDSSTIGNGSCNLIEIREPDVPVVTHNATEETYLYLNATDYLGRVSAFSDIGSYILTVGYNMSGDQVQEVSTYYYDISGFYNDYFKIGRRSGHLTVARTLSSRTYSFDVSFFYTVTYKNGTTVHNYTEADISVIALAGVGFNNSQYYVNVDVDYQINTTIVATMSDFLVYDDLFDVETVTFTRVSDTRFAIKPISGEITIKQHLDPLRTHYVRAYVMFNGTRISGQYYSSSTSVLVRVYTLGCFEEENGNVVWPSTHICDSATHRCTDYDEAFNEVGTVTRYCSKDGVWLKPDFSQCSLKPGTTPFVHVYFTFYTSNENHILRNLQSILRSAGGLLSSLRVTSLIPKTIKPSIVRYGIVVVLRGEVVANDTSLDSINTTMSRSTTFSRIRLQITGNGIIGFKQSGVCEYPDNTKNDTTFNAVCQTTGDNTCDCPTMTPASIVAAGACIQPATPPPPSPPIRPNLEVSADDVGNTSIRLQWTTSNTPGITFYNISYTAVISFNTEKGDTVTYPVKKFMSATSSPFTIGPLNPSTTYTFTVTAYTRNGAGPSDTITQSTDKGRAENPSFMQLRFTEIDNCDIWQEGSEMVNSVACELANQVSSYCQCQYTCDYVEIWTVRCDANYRDVILTGRLIPTNAQQGTDLMIAMRQWLETGRSYIMVNNDPITVDRQCGLAIDYPYAADCTIGNSNPSPGALGGGTDDNDDGDSTGTIVGGVIGGLLIICITIIVLVLIFQLFKRKQQKEESKENIPSSSYSAQDMNVKLAEDF